MRSSKEATPPIKMEQLNSYTGGNLELNQEILRLFDDQCRDLVARLESLMQIEDAKAWHDAAHSLKGAARGVGAQAVAQAAAAAEVIGPANSATAAAVTQLKIAAAATRRFIAEFLAEPR